MVLSPHLTQLHHHIPDAHGWDRLMIIRIVEWVSVPTAQIVAIDAPLPSPIGNPRDGQRLGAFVEIDLQRSLLPSGTPALSA
jgi:hypothetical protein